MQIATLLYAVLLPVVASLDNPSTIAATSEMRLCGPPVGKVLSYGLGQDLELPLGPSRCVTVGGDPMILERPSGDLGIHDTDAESSSASIASSTVVVGGSGLGLVVALTWAVGVMMVR